VYRYTTATPDLLGALDRMGVVGVRPAWYFWPVPRAFGGR
jgi:hypothetical protein